MINFLHNFNPQPLLLNIGIIKIHWYGVFIVLGILAAIGIAIKLGSYYQIPKDKIIDLSFYLTIFGIIGARIYHVFLEIGYYLNHPLDVFKIWQGGLAIHGAIIAGLLVVYYFAKKEKINFWLLTSLIVPGLALALATGRWGNYFNQELFGLPTNLGWGIPINITRRPLEYISAEYFHPTFIYESFGNILIFLILIILHYFVRKKKISLDLKKDFFKKITLTYLILYSLLRFSLEFIRIDRTPTFVDLRVPQIASLIIIFICIIFLVLPKKKKDVRID